MVGVGGAGPGQGGEGAKRPDLEAVPLRERWGRRTAEVSRVHPGEPGERSAPGAGLRGIRRDPPGECQVAKGCLGPNENGLRDVEATGHAADSRCRGGPT